MQQQQTCGSLDPTLLMAKSFQPSSSALEKCSNLSARGRAVPGFGEATGVNGQNFASFMSEDFFGLAMR